METQFCYNCGAQISNGGRFCSACGTPVLASQPVAEPIPAPENVAAPDIPAAPAEVFSLDDLAPAQPEPAPVATPGPAIFTLDALEQEEEKVFTTVQFPSDPDSPVAFQAPKPVEAPAPEPVYQPAPEPVYQPAPEPVYQPAPEPVYQPAPEPVQQPVPATVKKPAVGVLSRRGVGRGIIAVLLCIVIFLWSFATLTLLNIRLATNGDNAVVTIENALRSLDLTQIPATKLILNANPELSLAEWVLEKTAQNFSGRVVADEDELQEFLDDSEFIPFLAEQLSEYVNDIYSGNARKALSASDVEEFLWDERESMRDIFGQEVTKETARKMADYVAESGVLELMSTRYLKTNHSQIYNLVNLVMSWWILGIFGLILLLLLLLLNVINRSILRTCRDAGITVMVASGIWALCGLFYTILPGAWNSIFAFIEPLNSIIGSVLSSCLIPSAAAFGAGVVLLLIFVVGKKIASVRAAKLA